VAFGKLVLVASLLLGLFVLLRRILLSAQGGGPMEDLMALKAAGAQVVDVRTAAEFSQGHLAGSLNIPLDQFQARIPEIDPARPVLLCCASGGRSGMAKLILDKAGYAQVHNAGPWTRLQEGATS
jgi:rhodanese-related sulfurtransferase